MKLLRRYRVKVLQILNLFIYFDNYSISYYFSRFGNNLQQIAIGILYSQKLNANFYVKNHIRVQNFSVINKNCQIDDATIILDNVSVGASVKIGKNCLIYSGVRIYSDSIIGDNCIVHSNSVIGSDGFGFAPNALINKNLFTPISDAIFDTRSDPLN